MNFYGYKYEEAMELEIDTYNFLKDNMNRAKAKERMRELELHIYSNVKQETANKIHKNLVKLSNPPAEVAKRAVSTDDLKGFGGSIEDAIKAK